MKLISNIRDLKIMYITASIGVIAFEIGLHFDLDNVFKNNRNLNYITSSNYYYYQFLISKYGGTANFKYEYNLHYFLKLNELIYDNFSKIDQEKSKLKKIVDKISNKVNDGKYIIDKFNENTLNILLGKGDKEKYYSLLFLAIPFALKINQKDKLIDNLFNFVLV